MLFVKFHIGDDAYLFDAAKVVAFFPLVDLKRVPGAPLGIAGIFNHRGRPVPVVDLNELALGRPAAASFSTRLILLHFIDGSGRQRRLGAIAEKVTGMLRCEPGDFMQPGIASDGAPYLGRIAGDGDRLAQWVEVESLLSPQVKAALYRDAGEEA